MWSGNGFPGNSTTESGNRGSRKGIAEFSGVGVKGGCGEVARTKNQKKRGRRNAAGPLISSPPRLPASPPLSFFLRGSPESSQSPDVRRVPQLLEGSLPDLADAFPGDSE